MKTQRNIWIAFILNLSFSVFEFIGGLITGSVAIASDAVHDLGDAASIGISYFMEKKSKAKPDEDYTYGYVRYSVLGGLITTVILLLGAVAVIVKAVENIMNPSAINYDGMIVFAVIGVVVNFIAARVTHEGDSVNQKAVNLHMIEDVLGWSVVLIGAIVMRFTDFALLDPLMSIGVSAFILVNVLENVKEIAALFLEKTPHGVNVSEIRHHVCEISGVEDVHHIHIWSLDGQNHYATMHVVTDQDPQMIKAEIRHELEHHGIMHATLELERTTEHCHNKDCDVHTEDNHCHHHHHHH